MGMHYVRLSSLENNICQVQGDMPIATGASLQQVQTG